MGGLVAGAVLPVVDGPALFPSGTGAVGGAGDPGKPWVGDAPEPASGSGTSGTTEAPPASVPPGVTSGPLAPFTVDGTLSAKVTGAATPTTAVAEVAVAGVAGERSAAGLAHASEAVLSGTPVGAPGGESGAVASGVDAPVVSPGHAEALNVDGR